MADLTSSSTLAEIEAAYEDNCLYDVDNDTTEARLFIQACRYLMRRYPQQQNEGDASIRFPLEQIEEQEKDAVSWLAQNDSDLRPGGNRQFSLEDLR